MAGLVLLELEPSVLGGVTVVAALEDVELSGVLALELEFSGVVAVASGVPMSEPALGVRGVLLEFGVVLVAPAAFSRTALILSSWVFKVSRSLVTVSSWAFKSRFSFLRFSVSGVLQATNIKPSKTAKIIFMQSVYASLSL